MLAPGRVYCRWSSNIRSSQVAVRCRRQVGFTTGGAATVSLSVWWQYDASASQPASHGPVSISGVITTCRVSIGVVHHSPGCSSHVAESQSICSPPLSRLIGRSVGRRRIGTVNGQVFQVLRVLEVLKQAQRVLLLRVTVLGHRGRSSAREDLGFSSGLLFSAFVMSRLFRTRPCILSSLVPTETVWW